MTRRQTQTIRESLDRQAGAEPTATDDLFPVIDPYDDSAFFLPEDIDTGGRDRDTDQSFGTARAIPAVGQPAMEPSADVGANLFVPLIPLPGDPGPFPPPTPPSGPINGTPYADTLWGTYKNDVMNGYGGNDRIYGLSGNDVMDGGSGNDYLSGSSGDDTVEGGSGDDTIYGGSGNDTLKGEAGHDVLYGGSGDDDIDGGSGNDQIRGGPGRNDLDGGDGDDWIWGGVGNDTMRGGDGDDIIQHGVLGDHTFDGHDLVFCGDGDDLVISAGGNDTIFGQAGDDQLQGGADQDSLFGGTGNDYVIGGLGNDSLNGDSGDDDLIGGWGNDTLRGGMGADTLNGHDGYDKFVYASTQESTLAASDLIERYEWYADPNDDITGDADKIDLSAIDANTTAAGNQTFYLSSVGANANSVWTELLSDEAGSDIYGVYADNTGDAVADMLIRVEMKNGESLEISDFIL